MRICVADGEREQHKQLMDNLERRLHANHIVVWLRQNYMIGTSGSISKRSVYNHYLNVTKQINKKALISPTFFGKLVKRAFPPIKCNRKGPRGQTKQHYTHLQKIEKVQKDGEPAADSFPTGDAALLLDGMSDLSDLTGSPAPVEDCLSPIDASSKLFAGLAEHNDEMDFLSTLLPMKARGMMEGDTGSRASSPADTLFDGRTSPVMELKPAITPLKTVVDGRSSPATVPSAFKNATSTHRAALGVGAHGGASCMYCPDCVSTPPAATTTFFGMVKKEPVSPDSLSSSSPAMMPWMPICDEASAYKVAPETPIYNQMSYSNYGCMPMMPCPPVSPSMEQPVFFSAPMMLPTTQVPVLASSNPASPPSAEFLMPFDDTEFANWLLD